LLPKLKKSKGKKSSPGQTKIPLAEWDACDPEIIEVAEKFVLVNCYDPKIAMKLFHEIPEVPGMEIVES
jgi:putative transposase